MTIKGKLLDSFGAGVDQAESMHLSRGESEVCKTCMLRNAFCLIAWRYLRAIEITLSVD
jgi:hypothetical protein